MLDVGRRPPASGEDELILGSPSCCFCFYASRSSIERPHPRARIETVRDSRRCVVQQDVHLPNTRSTSTRMCMPVKTNKQSTRIRSAHGELYLSPSSSRIALKTPGTSEQPEGDLARAQSRHRGGCRLVKNMFGGDSARYTMVVCCVRYSCMFSFWTSRGRGFCGQDLPRRPRRGMEEVKRPGHGEEGVGPVEGVKSTVRVVGYCTVSRDAGVDGRGVT